jgi:hypothetical protein
MLVHPETLKMIGLELLGGMAERNTPLVQKIASTYFIKGATVSAGFSRPVVGP